jgi:hypothetical protein
VRKHGFLSIVVLIFALSAFLAMPAQTQAQYRYGSVVYHPGYQVVPGYNGYRTYYPALTSPYGSAYGYPSYSYARYNSPIYYAPTYIYPTYTYPTNPYYPAYTYPTNPYYNYNIPLPSLYGTNY